VPPLIYAVSDADGLAHGVLADGDALGEDDGLGEGDALGCGDPAAPEVVPVTRCPAGICAEPVVTSVREPTGGGGTAGTGARCPLTGPATAPARVAEAGT